MEYLTPPRLRRKAPEIGGERGPAGLELVLVQPSAERATARPEPLGAGKGFPVHGVVAAAVAASRHCKRVLPRRHMSLQLGACLGQLGLKSLSHA